ncbi:MULTISPECIES: hypothetical protein [Acetobacteraceae]|uniref:hypothetical protein n=1 Tax=Acetobacteraceae TaxID=433 RepID=UPI001E31BD16|nr:MULTISPECIES: hypothetical protein [Acetobacteraceae]MCE2576874.1 hypothetical protein [Komagataeibacter sp. FNDCR2]
MHTHDNEAHLLQRGLNAKAALDSGPIAAAFDELGLSYSQQLFATEPGDHEAREALYRKVAAIREVFGVLREWAAVADQIQAAEAQQEELAKAGQLLNDEEINQLYAR